jgi:hypothetical protein
MVAKAATLIVPPMRELLLPVFPDASVGFRNQRRLDVQLAVEVEIGEERHLGRLVELSPRGARLQLVLKLRPGIPLKLRRNGLTVWGSVSWADAATVGIRFDEPIIEDVFLGLRRSVPPEKLV